MQFAKGVKNLERARHRKQENKTQKGHEAGEGRSWRREIGHRRMKMFVYIMKFSNKNYFKLFIKETER